MKFTPGAALKNTLENASVTRYASPDTDYTTKGKDNGGSDWDDDDDFVDPTA